MFDLPIAVASFLAKVIENLFDAIIESMAHEKISDPINLLKLGNPDSRPFYNLKKIHMYIHLTTAWC